MAAQPGNMHNLTTLIKRLEAATSRLEDIASTVEGAPNGLDTTRSAQSTASAATVTAPASLAQAVSTPLPEAKPAEPLPRVVEDFDKLIEDEVAAFVAAANTLGGLIDQQAKAAQAAFQAERSFLLMTTKAKKPAPMSMEILSGIQEQLSEVDNIKTENRANASFTHLTMVAEGIIALGWVVEDARPGEYIDSLMGSAQYSGNKVLKEYKEKDQNHVKYVQSFYKVMRSLSQFVKDNYKTGLTWNQKDGGDATEILREIQLGGTATPKPSVGGAAPPPPPPPPLPTFDAQNGFTGGPGAPPPPPAPAAAAKGGDMTAVFDQLNQGSAVTAGLRKVDKSQMTHKNPSLRATPTRSDSTGSGRSKSPMPAKKPDSLKGKKPGRKELDGTKWIVENFENTGNEIIEIPAEMNHSILISKCSKCVIKVTGKATAISIDNSNGLSILIGSLVSSIDVIKSTKFALQVDGQLPTVLMDQVDGAQIYLQEASMKSPPEIVTSKCSAINIVTPPQGDEDDSKETPLPEQLRTYFKNGQLVTEVVEHAG